MKSFLSTKDSLDREEIRDAKTEKVKDGFPGNHEEIFAAKYRCVELMFYILIILRGKRADVKWRSVTPSVRFLTADYMDRYKEFVKTPAPTDLLEWVQV